MEAAMYKATITVTLAILAVALLASGSAQAGGATSAASKYGRTNQVATNQAQVNRQAQRSGFPITEYSSSSARTHAPKYR
jgi:hypothetical protein